MVEKYVGTTYDVIYSQIGEGKENVYTVLAKSESGARREFWKVYRKDRVKIIRVEKLSENYREI